ncbi:MAG: ribonuclease P protein component [Candidatus Portnoybacteria bacterium RBG_13_41_18]|uniref:Ribonuclease P protein component n=1 Tax=Candidatus Portnoybacteria bacterium RBG_13_41_18 TaxID=1801991 RepID=A0A1G2F839_9BACT|nr:MAG: ribonuclease P protein component [Candidatus Portnoybacteria bacterium RBG_13_41_18]
MINNRLKKTTEINQVFRAGKRMKTDFFDFLFVTKANDCCSLAVIVSTKISKKATERNRIKRQIKEAARNLIGQAAKGGNMLVVVKKEIYGKTTKEIKQKLENAFKLSGFIS